MVEGKPDKSNHLLSASMAMFFLLAVFFHRVIFFGYSLWPVDHIFNLQPWNFYAPYNYNGPYNYLLFDHAFLSYPWLHLASEIIRAGELPLWNPYISCGWPFFANSYGFFYPLNIFFYILPFWYAFGLVAFVKLFLAGFFTYIYLRNISVNPFGSMIGAITFMLSGVMIVWLGGTVPNIALFLPLLLLLTGKLVAMRSLIYASLLSIIVGVSFLGGHYETTFHILAATGLYFLFCLFTKYQSERNLKESFHAVIFFLGAIIIGVAIASVQIIPSWEYIKQSSLLGARSASGFHLNITSEAFVQFFKSLKGLVLYVIPDFYGNPVDHNDWGSAVGMWYYVEQSGYAGILPLFLAIFAVIACYKNKFVLFFAGLGFLSLGIVYRLPLVADAVSSLPVFSKLNNNRIILVYCFAVAVLAGHGVNYLTDKSDRNWKKVYLSLAVFLSFSIFLALGLWYLISNGALGNIIMKYNVHDYISGKIWLFLLWAVTGILLLFVYAQKYINKTVFQVLLLVLISADLLVFGMGFWPTTKPEKIYPSTPAIEFLKKDKDIFRIYGVGNVLSTNTGVPYRLQDIRGYDGIALRDYEKFITGKAGDITFFMGGNYIPWHADLMNVKYILFPAGMKVQGSRFVKVYSGEIDIYLNNNYIQRAFVVNKARVINDGDEALKLLYSGNFDPSKEVIIGSDLPAEFKGLIESPLAKNNSPSSIAMYRHDRVTVDVDMNDRGVLVLSDTFYPGWKAFVDGAEKTIYRADYIFRAVPLEKGRHRVEFRYEPDSFRIGAIISLLTFLFVTAILIFDSIKHKKNRKVL